MKLDAYDFIRTNRRIFKDEVSLLYHIAVSKITLICTAAYNTITHPECFILANLDQYQ